jgi:endonuclease YncB( thermonuclease family)
VEHVLYNYKAVVTEVYDGDTITVDIDLGLHAWIKGEKIRFNRINAPEMRGVEKDKGKISRDYLRGLILNKEIIIETIKDTKGKYGRYLGEIWVKINDKDYINVNDDLVKKNYAIYKKY